MRPGRRRVGALVTALTSATAVALTAHTAVNLRALRQPGPSPSPPAEPVSVLLPLRDEAHRVGPTLTALRQALDRVPRVELLVLDDGSTDRTGDVVRRRCGTDHRVRLIEGTRRPDGWLGKTWACWQLAQQADPRSTVLVFVDADVMLAPQALPATVDLLRSNGLDLVSPYPRQLAEGLVERLVQPLLQWSWLTTLPLGLAERSTRPSLSAANGQLLAVDRATYDRAGGHGAVRGAVLDDIALLRAIKAAGGRGGMVDGTALASCRMYHGWAQLRDGYTKSLWSAFGGPRRGLAAATGLGLVYGWPAVAALAGSPVGGVGYLAAVAGRVLTGRRTGGRVWPDALAHPASVAVLGWLVARSARENRRGTLRWKGRPVR